MSAGLRFYLSLLFRRLPAMLLLFFACTLVGLMLALGLPATYASQARMLVQGQAISENLAASMVQITGLEEVLLLREQLVTRANLIEIANEFDVFEDLREMTPDDIYEAMLEATLIATEGGGTRTAPAPVLLTVAFEARTPQIAADVVNEYTTRILSANVRRRTGQAGETLSFFEQEVERLNNELQIRSARITEFQRENADALPEEQDFRLQRQALLQERIASAERERRTLLESRQRTIQIFQAGAAPAGTSLPPDQRLLRDLENELQNLLLTFSENAPQVQNIRRRIEQVEQRIAAQARLGGGEEQEDEGAEMMEGVDPLLALQLAEIDSRVEALDAQIEESTAELERLDDAIARAPLNAIQLERLQRDFDNMQVQFENARNALAQASIGERLEVGGRGQRISVLEPPVVASEPTRPNRLLLAGGGVFMGLFMAVGLFVLLELTNRTVRRPAELVSGLGITPFVTLPDIEPAGRRMLRRTMRGAVTLLILAGVPAGLWALHAYVMPLDQLSQQLLARVGLT
jgi:uncharacterized protein involved in exopolysaccharide biosynthesis